VGRLARFLSGLVLGVAVPSLSPSCEGASFPESAALEKDRRDPGETDPPSPPWRLKTYEGEVTKVIHRPRRSGTNAMLDVLLRCGREEFLVRLAPVDFLKQKRFAVVEGDILSVKAYPMTSVEGKLLVATEVARRRVILRLRDSPGRPVWKK
jgi:hypothetical protein